MIGERERKAKSERERRDREKTSNVDDSLLIYRVRDGHFWSSLSRRQTTDGRYSSERRSVFLIVGHTKNAADRIFNLVKLQYRKRNLFTFGQLTEAVATSEHVSVHSTTVEDFKDWETHLNNFYTDYSGMVKQNHIFSCNYKENRDGNRLNAYLRESDMPEDTVTKKNVIKQTFLGRRLLFGGSPHAEAVNARPQIMQAALDGNLKDGDGNAVGKLDTIESNGINIFKKVELAYKFKPIIPFDCRDDDLYATPPPRSSCSSQAGKGDEEVCKGGYQRCEAKGGKEIEVGGKGGLCWRGEIS